MDPFLIDNKTKKRKKNRKKKEVNWFKLDGIVMMAKILSELESIHCIREFCFSVAAKSLRVGQQPAIYFRAASGTLAAGVRVNQPTKAFSAVTLLFRFSGRRCCNLSPLPLPIVIAPLFRCLQHQWWRLTAPRKQKKKKEWIKPLETNK